MEEPQYNLVVETPKEVRVQYLANRGWWITIDGVTVRDETRTWGVARPRYWENRNDAVEYIHDRSLCAEVHD